MALLISPNRPDSPVFAHDPKTGFTLKEIEGHIAANGKAFRIDHGGLLVVDSLLCHARAAEMNLAATCVLRHAVDDPGADVCGIALMLGSGEASLLPANVQSGLFLSGPDVRTALLLDRNDEVRQTIALGLENHGFRAIQARMAADAANFCQRHRADVLVVDLTSLEPHALDTLRNLRETQPKAGVLLISGYDRFRVEQRYPRLLGGVQFLEKPFNLSELGEFLRPISKLSYTQAAVETLAGESTDSS